MTCFSFTELLLFLLLLLLHKAYSEEPDHLYRAEGGMFLTGYCFRTDYIVVYRSTPEGDQLIGNSSNKNMPNTPPADLRGRTDIKDNHNLLGFQISNLTHLDSGIYRRECWKNQMIINQKTQQLTVCKKEIKSELINLNKSDGGTELLCRSSAIGSEETSVRWYYEMLPSYEPTLFLDSSISLKPLVEELAGFVAVKDNGAMLVFNNMLKKNTYFKCLVIKGKNCISFQNMYPPDDSQSKDLFVSLGDRVVLNCSADDSNQAWETPLGRIDGNSTRDNQLYILADDFSLVIPSIFDNHTGDYLCISPLREMHYLLFLCPNNEPQEKVVYEGGTVSLACNFGQDVPERVQWHRFGLSDQYEIIYNSQDKTIPIPEDLQHRVTLSENGSSLTIYNLEMNDGGKYGCAALKSPSFPVNYRDYNDYDENITKEDESSNQHQWIDPPECIFKEEIILTILVKRDKGRNFNCVTSSNNSAPSAAFNATTFAVVAAVLVGLLVVGTIVTAVAVKKRVWASPTQREVTPDIKMNVDPSCTERLTPSE